LLRRSSVSSTSALTLTLTLVSTSISASTLANLQSEIYNLGDEDPISVDDPMAFSLNFCALGWILRDTSCVWLHDMRSAQIVRCLAYDSADAEDGAGSVDALGRFGRSVAAQDCSELPVNCREEYSTRSSRRACSPRSLAAQLGSFVRDTARHSTDLSSSRHHEFHRTAILYCWPMDSGLSSGERSGYSTTCP